MGMGLNQFNNLAVISTKPIPTLALPLKGEGIRSNSHLDIGLKFQTKFQVKFQSTSRNVDVAINKTHRFNKTLKQLQSLGSICPSLS
jgi:hypothetical protein